MEISSKTEQTTPSETYANGFANTEHNLVGAEVKGFSCLICRQRKIKCDRRTPCNNCSKAGRDCSFVAPTRGKRKRLKPPKEGLHARLKRYEDLLRTYGVQIEPSSYDDDGESGSDEVKTPDAEMATLSVNRSMKREDDPYGLRDTNPKFITNGTDSRYLDSALWNTIGQALPQPDIDGLKGVTDSPEVPVQWAMNEVAEQNSMLFEELAVPVNFADLHPSDRMLSVLQEVYADRVDPMMKILHLPTFWEELKGARAAQTNASKSTEALCFAFYLATVSTMEEDECRMLLSAEKDTLFVRFKLATRQSLINAQYLSCSDLTTLRALAMFIMAMRGTYRIDTIHILSGVAVRIARRMGLHRDGSSLGLSPFETEMRRRLWCHLTHVDFRTSDIMSQRPSMDLFTSDTKFPINVHDEDLTPEMAQLPEEREGITAVTFALFRCDLTKFLQKFSPSRPNDVRFGTLGRLKISLEEKEKILADLEDTLERKYTRYCDPTIGLHYWLSVMARSALCKLRLHLHDPRNYAGSDQKISERERDIIFTSASKLLEYTTLLSGNAYVEKYMWQVSVTYMWTAILFILFEMRERKTGPEVDRQWRLIGVVLTAYPNILCRKVNGAASIALRKFVLDVWDNYVNAKLELQHAAPLPPSYILEMRRFVNESALAQNKKDLETALCTGPPVDSPLMGRSTDLGAMDFNININPASYGDERRTPLDWNASLESYDISNLFSFDMGQDEWLQFDSMVAAEDVLTLR